MDKKKIQQLIQAAKLHYLKNPEKYNPILTYGQRRVSNATISPPIHNTSPSQSESPISPSLENPFLHQEAPEFQPQQFQQPQQTIPSQQPQINVVGNPNPQVPINIIAKNYISPESLEDGDVVEKKNIKKKAIQLAKIPDSLLKSSSTDWEPINFRGIDVSYDLYELAKVHIKYDEVQQKVIYHIIEPELSVEDREIYEELKKGFIYVFERIASEEIDGSPEEIVVQGAKRLCSKYRISVTPEQLTKLVYYLKRDFLGLEIIEPLMHDPYIEDVSCDGLNIPIFVNHLKYGPLEVNRKYTNGDKLNSFIVKLAQKSNQEVSLSKPILQGALPDGSRVEAIYGKEVSEKGSSYTIRKFRAEPFTPIHLIEFGTMPPFLLAYLWLAVENRQSLLVSGGTATGKTTILNALSLFVPPTSKIVSIEDTPEINLPHEHWLPMISRETNEKSEVSMFDLLKASLRERPDYIIVGEIRGAEAAILFQGMATGHAGMGTVHAEKFEDLVNRMTIKPINLPKQLLTELNIAIFMKQFKIKNNVVRRCSAVVEIIDYHSRSDSYETNDFVTFKPSEDEFDFAEHSGVISNLIKLRGGSEDSLWNEIEKRRRILDIMHKKKILEFNDVSNVIRSYYKDPGAIFDYLEQYQASPKKE
jgi:flagellar protein FlaI